MTQHTLSALVLVANLVGCSDVYSGPKEGCYDFSTTTDGVVVAKPIACPDSGHSIDTAITDDTAVDTAETGTDTGDTANSTDTAIVDSGDTADSGSDTAVTDTVTEDTAATSDGVCTGYGTFQSTPIIEWDDSVTTWTGIETFRVPDFTVRQADVDCPGLVVTALRLTIAEYYMTDWVGSVSGLLGLGSSSVALGTYYSGGSECSGGSCRLEWDMNLPVEIAVYGTTAEEFGMTWQGLIDENLPEHSGLNDGTAERLGLRISVWWRDLGTGTEGIAVIEDAASSSTSTDFLTVTINE